MPVGCALSTSKGASTGAVLSLSKGSAHISVQSRKTSMFAPKALSLLARSSYPRLIT
jgi:hypothetical protein